MSQVQHLVLRAEQEFTRVPYGYTPTTWIAIIFVVLFGLSAGLHAALAVRYRRWLFFATLLGWAGRLWSSYDVFRVVPVSNPVLCLSRITCTIIAPTFTLAGVFSVLGEIIGRLGREYARLTPRLYFIIFVTADVVALVVQAIGGGTAASAENDDHDKQKLGGNIMLGGIIFQLIVLVVAVILAAEYFFRYLRKLPLHRSPVNEEKATRSNGTLVEQAEDTRHVRIMMGAISLVALLLVIRAIYRTIELADGWTGRIIETQVYFNVLDGAMIVLAQYVLVFFHPGRLLRDVVTKDTPKQQSGSNENVA
ncbi:RTA1-domain-containing protein [Flagelloscypha sp. PMI_526]|nr:RTA1-domain-containing protein [Flagelloscypha sp. PMI_526]